MNYIVTPNSHEWGSGGGGGTCTQYCSTKVIICQTNTPCGSNCNKSCFIYFP